MKPVLKFGEFGRHVHIVSAYGHPRQPAPAQLVLVIHKRGIDGVKQWCLCNLSIELRLSVPEDGGGDAAWRNLEEEDISIGNRKQVESGETGGNHKPSFVSKLFHQEFILFNDR